MEVVHSYYISDGKRGHGYRKKWFLIFAVSTREVPCNTCDHEKHFHLETASRRLGSHKKKKKRVERQKISHDNLVKVGAGYFPCDPPEFRGGEPLFCQGLFEYL